MNLNDLKAPPNEKRLSPDYKGRLCFIVKEWMECDCAEFKTRREWHPLDELDFWSKQSALAIGIVAWRRLEQERDSGAEHKNRMRENYPDGFSCNDCYDNERAWMKAYDKLLKGSQ